jgi:TolB-like protein
MSGEVPAYTLNLMGPFRLLRPDGARIEVTSKRGVALIAMLAMAAEGERTRDWLQDRLWSQRQRPQAQSSLRRELTNLRRSLNHRQPPLLICEHQRVKLDLGQLRIDARPASDDLLASVGALAAGEFLEGFDLAGEEAFEEWLREQRSAQRARADAAAGSGSVAGRGPGGSTRVMAVVSMAIIDEEDAAGVPDPLSPRGALHAVLTGLAEDQNGQAVATAAGGAVFAFPEARRAVAFAIAFQRRNEAETAWLRNDRHLRFRIGVSVGEVVERAGMLRGYGIASAIQLQQAASVGGVMISEQVRETLVEGLDPPVMPMGSVAGTDRIPPLSAFQIVLRTPMGGGPRTAGQLSTRIVDTSHPTPGFGDRPALAVLPFANLTGNPVNDYLCEGISEDLIDRLSRLRWLPVIARNSSFSFAADKVDARIIGQSLGAKYLLEGRLRVADDGFSLSTGLSDVASGYNLWSQRRPLPPRQSQDALDQLVTGLVGVLDAQIDYAEQVRARGRRENRLEFNDLIWRGRWHLNRLNKPDSEIARDLFMQALELEPNSPEALIQVTFSIGWSIWADRGSEAETTEMRRYAQRAIIADPDDGRGHMLAGIAEMWLRQPTRARTLLEQAIALNPSLVQAHAQLGCHFNLVGEPATAITPLRTALRLSPNDIHIFFILGELAMAYLMLGRWTEAIEYADQSLIRRPAYWYAQMVKINALARGGDPPAAAAAFEELRAVRPNFSRRFLEWIPFVDRAWTEYLVEGIALAAPDWLGARDGTADRAND